MFFRSWFGPMLLVAGTISWAQPLFAQAPNPADDGPSIFQDDGKMPTKKSKPANDSTAGDRQPVPTDVARLKADKVVRGNFKTEINAATSVTAKSALAKKALASADRVTDSAEKYCTLTFARDTAREGQDPETALAAIDAIDEGFRVDALALKRELMTQKFTPGNTLIKSLHAVVEAAVAEDRYDIAREMATAAVSAATASRGSADAENAYLKDVANAEKAFKAANGAAAALAKNPADPTANLHVGTFRCFYKGDWDAGLPNLAKSNDAALKSLAEADLSGAKGAAASLAHGDRLWDLSLTLGPLAKKNVQERAAAWYDLALPNLTGADKTKIEKRIALITGVPTAPPTGGKPAVVATGNPSAKPAGRPGSPVGSWLKLDSGAAVVLNADGSYTITRKNGKESKGRWVLRTGKVVLLKLDAGKDVELEFTSPDELEGGKWHLKR